MTQGSATPAGSSAGGSRARGHRPVPSDFARRYGLPLSGVLDISAWRSGEDTGQLGTDLDEGVVAAAVQREEQMRPMLRQDLLTRLAHAQRDLPDAGIYLTSSSDIEQGLALLLAGGVEAADGTYGAYETIPIVVDQIGVCLTSYRGQSGTFAFRLYGRDLWDSNVDRAQDLHQLLTSRRQRDALGQTDGGTPLSRIVRRGLMAYAERALLLEKASAPWRMGHGMPVAYELLLLTGHDGAELAEHSIRVLRRLLLDQQQWVYVPSAPHDAELLTLGQALHAGEYAIVERADAKLRALLHSGSAEVRRRQDLVRFLSDAGKAIVRGVYRSSELAPPVLFYAHKDYTHAAALVALSDSTLQEHRGFPLLIDLADRICAGAFARHALVSQIDALIASTSSSPFQWLGERHTRPWGR